MKLKLIIISIFIELLIWHTRCHFFLKNSTNVLYANKNKFFKMNVKFIYLSLLVRGHAAFKIVG